MGFKEYCWHAVQQTVDASYNTSNIKDTYLDQVSFVYCLYLGVLLAMDDSSESYKLKVEFLEKNQSVGKCNYMFSIILFILIDCYLSLQFHR